MENGTDLLKELIANLEYLQQFYEEPRVIFPHFLSWINNVTNTLEASGKDKELEIWHRATDNYNFSIDEMHIVMAQLKPVLLGMQKRIEPFVAYERIEQLAAIKSPSFDLTKLIQLCRELNYCYADECYLAVGMLIRSILDHVPPIFGVNEFVKVANNYNGGISFKSSMAILQNSSRKIADAFLHIPIRVSETLPTKNQVAFGADLDVLLGEIVRLLK